VVGEGTAEAVQGIATETVVGTGNAGVETAVGLVPRRTAHVAEIVALHEEAREAAEAVGAVRTVEAALRAGQTELGPAVVVPLHGHASESGSIKLSEITAAAGETLAAIEALQAVHRTSSTYCGKVIEILPQRTLAATHSLAEKVPELTENAIEERKAGSASRSAEHDCLVRVLEVPRHGHAAGSLDRQHPVLPGVAGQTQAQLVARKAIVGAGDANEGDLVRVGAHWTACVAEVVEPEIVAARAAEAVGGQQAGGTADGTRRAHCFQVVKVPRHRHAPQSPSAEDSEISGSVAGEALSPIVAGVAVVRAGDAGVGELGGKEARLAGGEADPIGLQEGSGLAVEAGSGRDAGRAVLLAHWGHPRSIFKVAHLSHAAIADSGDDAMVNHSIAGGALAVEGAELAVGGAGNAGEGGVVGVVVGRTEDGAEEVEVEEVARKAGDAVGLGLAEPAAEGTHHAQLGPVVIVPRLRQAPGNVAKEHPQVTRLVAGKALAQGAAGVAVVGTGLAIEGLVGGVVADRTARPAHPVTLHEVARQAGQAPGRLDADGASGRTGRAGVGVVFEVADEGVASLSGGGEDPEVADGTAGSAPSLAVAAVALEGTFLA
jgi:hypothetical protein